MNLTNQNGGELLPEPENILREKTPEELKEYIRTYHTEYLNHVKRAFIYGTTIGYILGIVKEQLGSRKFSPYLQEVGINRQTAYNYLFIYKHREEIASYIAQGYTIAKIFSILKGKPPKEEDPKQPKFIEDPEQIKERERQEALKKALRKEKQAWYGRKKRAIKNKAINKNDIPIWEEEGKKKIEEGEKLKQEGIRQLEQLKYLRIIEGK